MQKRRILKNANDSIVEMVKSTLIGFILIKPCIIKEFLRYLCRAFLLFKSFYLYGVS
ncbi:hypothetical protein M918_08040 [Clostridium sp. BL8]|nr:hypothetical protein M918_08040 [Clostridium sp. BL8]